MSDLKRLKVVIDADKDPLKKKLDAAGKDVKDFEKTADKSAKSVDFSPMEMKLQKTIASMKKIAGEVGKAISLDGQGYSMKGLKRDIREATASAKSYVKEAQLASGLKVYNEDYLRMKEESGQLAESLAKVRNSMLEMKKNGTDKQTSEQYREASSYLDELNVKYDKLSKTMASMEGKKLTKTQQGKFQEMEEEQKRLAELIDATEKRMAEMERTGKNVEFTSAFQKAREEAGQLSKQLEYLKHSTQNMESTGTDTKFTNQGLSTGSYVDTGFATAKQAAGDLKNAIAEMTANAKQKVQDLVKSIPVIGRAATEASAIVKKGFSGMRAVMDKVTPAIRRAGGAAASLIKRFASGVPGIKRFTKAASGNDSGGGLKLGLKNVLKYAFGIRSLFVLVNKLRSAMQAGLKNVAGSSKTTQGSLNSLQNSFTSLQNAAGAAAAPLVNAFAPAITTVIGYVVDAINAVGMFIAALTGASSYTAAKFNKSTTSAASGLKNTGSAAQGAKKDVDNLKRSLMGFDEINKLDDSSSGGSGGSGGAGGAASGGGGFTTEKVSTDAQNLADKVKEIWSTIFDPMQIAWNIKGEGVINAWKNALESVKDLTVDIGKTFLQVWSDGAGYETTYNILTNVELIGKALDGVATAFKNAWDDGNTGYNYVKSIFGAFNEILRTINAIGKALIDVWNDNGTGEKAIGNILKIFTDINDTTGNISRNIREAFTSDNMGKKTIQGVADIFNNMLDHVRNITKGLKDWSNNLDFKPLMKSISNLVDALKPLGDKLGGGLEALFKNVLQPMAKWATETGIPKAINAIAAALEAIDAVIEAVSPALSWLWKNFLEPLAKWTGGVIASVLDGIANALKKIADLANTAGDWISKLFGGNSSNKVDVDINGNIVSTTDKTGGKSKVDSTANLNKANNSLTGRNKPSVDTYAHFDDKKNGLTGKSKPSIDASARFNESSNALTGKSKPSIGTTARFNDSDDGFGKKRPGITAKANFSSKGGAEQAKGWIPSIVAKVVAAASGKKTKKKEKGGSFYGGTWHNIPQFSRGGVLTTRTIQRFADGGAPDHGTTFVAGENGPEIVGHIGGRTEVLNASQIASAIYSAVYSAMMAVSGKNSTQVNVTLQGTARAFFKAMQQEARDYTARTGKPAFS